MCFIKLAAPREPGCHIDSTDKLVGRIDGRTCSIYKMRIPAPKNSKGFVTSWQCIANRKDASIFVTSLKKLSFVIFVTQLHGDQFVSFVYTTP